ncbi:MAG: MG2 domain-containing protein [Verrucomicrobia bacterium]|nr:MG2 domain-containing protein [Verrucomicrobiota bacterium]
MKTKHSFVRVLIATVGRLVGFMLGQMSWSAPPWLAWCGRRLVAFLALLKAHPRAAALSLILLVALGTGTWQAWRWWKSHQPRTFAHNVLREVAVTVQAPAAVAPGAPDQGLKPGPLRLTFSGAPVAPLEKIGKDATEAVTLDPQVQGKWTWQDGSTLVFQPTGHWPPDTAFKVRLRHSALAKDLHLERESVTVKTPPLVAGVHDFSFYNSPQDPSVYQVVAELKLSHPVALEALQQRLRMEVLGGTPLFMGGTNEAPVFSVSADPASVRRYFIRSRQISVPLKEDWVKLTVPAGLVSSLVGEPLAKESTAKTRVPDKFSGLELTKAETRIIRTDEGEPQQFVFITTNLDIDSAEIARRIGLWWHQDGWQDNQGHLIFGQREPSATQVELVPVESEAPVGKQHAFRFIEPRPNGALLLRVGAGVKSPGGFETNTRFEKVLRVPPFPQETRLLGKGHVLALDGERKLVVQSRAIDHLRLTLSRVPVSQFQHLISLNRWNTFNEPSFDGVFSKDNIAQKWSKVVAVPHQNAWAATQTVIDIAEAPPLTAPDQLPGGRGVFFVTVEPVRKLAPPVPTDDLYSRIEPSAGTGEDDWHGDDEDAGEPKDGWQRADGEISERLIMATDLGLLAKTAADGSRDVYVMALGAGQPVAAVEIRAIARNGSVLETATTDASGHARLSPLADCTGERQPIAVLAAKDGDTSFLPFNERRLPAMDYSRFEIGGVIASRIKAVEACVFTERGVYRPGDTVHGGFIVRRRDWQPVLEGLPLAISLTDSHGREVGKQSTRLPYDGFFACDFPLSDAAALGIHEITVNVLNSQGRPLFRLGRAVLRVEEFQPDRMKVSTKLDPAPPAGWLACTATDAVVSVQSLFGEPAPERRVTMRLDLSPADFGFPEWPGFAFYINADEAAKSMAGRTIDLGEAKTDANGSVTFKLPLDTLKDATFRAAVLTEAFEREGGRSVRTATTCLVSPHESVLGWKTDGNLEYLAKDSGQALKLLAVGRDLKPLALDNLRRRIIEIRQVSVLTKLDNGNYAYVSTSKQRQVSEEPISLPAGETEYQLPCGKAGDFRLEIIDAESAVCCAVPFTVVGKGEENASVDREAELRLQLSKEEILPGGELEVHLSAPYAGAGLVTLERERVIVAQWFRTATKESTVTLRIPDDAEGTYYINASFVRSTSAPEVFHSPLSYAAAPVKVLAPKKTLAYQLDAPREVRPGTAASFGITSNEATRLVIYAVDEGIHQITSYKLPQPLDFFLRKQALEVRTQQWLDLLLPEFRFLKAAAAFGGDGGDAALSLHLNPFKRRQEPPVVFWSGIIEAGPQRTEVKWNVPDYFNGNLRIMAVGCNAGAIGTAQTATLVKAPIIVQPNAPLFVTPGDEFETSVSVFNHLAATGETAIRITATPSGHLEVIGDASASLPLASGSEGIVRFRFRTKDQLGAAELKFEATGGGETVHRVTTLSVRPASHHLTSVTTGWFRTGSTEEKVKRTLYQEFRHTEATASIVPLGLARGLEAYVREYPYGCSEQITSRAMVKLVASTEADFGLTPKDAAEALRSAISQLASRQRADGGFGYWYAGPSSDYDWYAGPSSDYEFHSLYVLHFLSEAKLLGHAVPEQLLSGALKYASRTARATVRNLYDAELQAYAIYLLARDGTNPAPQLLNLRDTLTATYQGQWEHRSAAAWMAATYMLLKKDGEANNLLDACLKARAAIKAGTKDEPWSYYRTPAMEEIGIFYIQCRHFPERARKFGIDALEPIMKPLREQSFNTLSCSYMTLALKAYSDLARSTGVEVSIRGIVAGNEPPQLLAGPGQGILRTPFGPTTTALRFERQQKGSGDIGAFFQVVEQGYDSGKPTGPERSGLEVSREITPVRKDQALRVGDPVEVVLRVRNVSGRNLTNLAVVDLLPAGFEVLADDLKSGANTVAGTEFAELREDRTLFFLGLAANAEWSVQYRMKALCAGTFAVPAALAEDMYERGFHGVSTPGRIPIEAAK